MSHISMAVVVSAGGIKADDDYILALQGIAEIDAQTLADMLAMASNGEAHVRYMEIGRSIDIKRRPQDVTGVIPETKRAGKYGTVTTWKFP